MILGQNILDGINKYFDSIQYSGYWNNKELDQLISMIILKDIINHADEPNNDDLKMINSIIGCARKTCLLNDIEYIESLTNEDGVVIFNNIYPIIYYKDKVVYHDTLKNRDKADQHPIESITNLREELIHIDGGTF